MKTEKKDRRGWDRSCDPEVAVEYDKANQHMVCVPKGQSTGDSTTFEDYRP